MGECKKEIRLDLEKKLKVIGWKLRNCGCEYYNIVNHKEEGTAFMYRSGEIRLDGNDDTFGGRHNGALIINLSKCDIEVHDGHGGPNIFIVGKEGDSKKPSIFLSFYNFDNKESGDV